jgi:capsular exopolysaccharide synthesis family protein
MIGKKVLLIDCDLRKPKIHKNFGLNRALGLTDILIYNRIDNYKNIVQEFKIPNKDYKIDIITAGSKVSNPSEILSSNRFKEFIEKLKNDYDLILIDCPPVSLMTDAVVISKISSGTAYVIEYDRFNYSAINKCLEQLKDVNANVLGGIITKMNINKQKKLYGDQYEQYYSNYIS